MVLRVLLAMRCCSCGYSIVCRSYGLYGSISIYYKAGLHVCGCTYAYNLTVNLIGRILMSGKRQIFLEFIWSLQVGHG